MRSVFLAILAAGLVSSAGCDPSAPTSDNAIGSEAAALLTDDEARAVIRERCADALDTPISVIMREVGDRLAVIEGIDTIPDTIPADMVAGFDADLVSQ